MDRTEGEDAFAAEIHQRLLAGDRIATTDLYAHYAQSLLRRIRRKWQTLDEGFVYDAVIDAILDYGDHPQRFDPARKTLRWYLYMAADRNAYNKHQQDRRQRGNVVPLYPDAVENDDEPGNTELGRTEDFVPALIGELTADEIDASVLALCETEEERIVARLIIEGEKQTAVFAQALGLTGLSVNEQQARIFRIKDRLMKRWARARKDIHHV